MNSALMTEARTLAPMIEEIFYTLHRNPELGDQEYATSALIKAELEKMGIEAIPMAGTGVMGVIRGGKPGKTIGFRADMDALPVQEETGLPYASQVPGVMHACGHDAHVAILLGTAKMLMARREELPGNVKLFFQPNEEVTGGAERMILEGCMENPSVDAVICGHVGTGNPVGKVSVKYGAVTSACNGFKLVFRGKGTHGANPHLGTDVIVAACQAVTALQTISSRRCAPTEPVIVTIGSFQAGTVGNVIPETATILGTIRTLTAESRAKVKDAFRQIVNNVAAAMDVTVDIDIMENYPAGFNDTAMSDIVCKAAEKVLGPNSVEIVQEPRLGTDDFAYFSERVPGCYYFVGVGNKEKSCNYPGHNPRFAVDPEALPGAMAHYVQIVLDFLES